MRHLERIEFAWEHVVHPELQLLTHEPLSPTEKAEIESNLLIKAASPALAAAAALDTRAGYLGIVFSRGMRIRPLGQLISQWYDFAATPIVMTSVTIKAEQPVRTYRRWLKAFPHPQRDFLESNEENDRVIAAMLEVMSRSLSNDQSGAELIQYALEAMLPEELDERPDVAHFIDHIAHLGAERYRAYYSHAFQLLYSGGRSR